MSSKVKHSMCERKKILFSVYKGKTINFKCQLMTFFQVYFSFSNPSSVDIAALPKIKEQTQCFDTNLICCVRLHRLKTNQMPLH